MLAPQEGVPGALLWPLQTPAPETLFCSAPARRQGVGRGGGQGPRPKRDTTLGGGGAACLRAPTPGTSAATATLQQGHR